jgi:hypothetical protein
MRLFGRKREEPREEPEKKFLKPLQSREVIPGRKWEVLDDDGTVLGEHIIHDPEAHRRFVASMGGGCSICELDEIERVVNVETWMPGGRGYSFNLCRDCDQWLRHLTSDYALEALGTHLAEHAGVVRLCANADCKWLYKARVQTFYHYLDLDV